MFRIPIPLSVFLLLHCKKLTTAGILAPVLRSNVFLSNVILSKVACYQSLDGFWTILSGPSDYVVRFQGAFDTSSGEKPGYPPATFVVRWVETPTAR